MFLTKRQSQLLDHLRKTIAIQGYAPSLEEMAAHFGLSSVGTVHKHLKALEEKGFIRRQWNRSRAIEIVDLPDGKARRLPVLGRIRGGRPIEVITDADSIAVPEDFLGRGKAFVLQVLGNDLRAEFLDHGDYIVVEQREAPAVGDTVVALVDGQSATVGQWHTDAHDVRLLSRANGQDVLVVRPDRCRVEGVVVGVLRRFGI